MPVLLLCGLTLPGIDNRNIIVNDDITTLNIAVGDEGEVAVTLLECNGPVDEVELSLLANVLCKTHVFHIHQGTLAPAQQGSHPERPQQLQDGAGCSTAWKSIDEKMN